MAVLDACCFGCLYVAIKTHVPSLVARDIPTAYLRILSYLMSETINHCIIIGSYQEV